MGKPFKLIIHVLVEQVVWIGFAKQNNFMIFIRCQKIKNCRWLLPDFFIPFVVETDASGTGVGAVLTQNGHPLAYFSQKLSPRMQAASAYKREMQAIILVVWKWQHYLLGSQFTILTDQQSL